MAKVYDVIVVGAGIAGLLAAKTAGENGLEVALLEKKADPTQLVRACGQTLISMNEYYFGNLCNYNAREKLICFSSDGFCFKYDGPYQNLYNLVIVTPNGHKVEYGDYEEQKGKGDPGRVGLSFDKEIMFQGLLEEIKAHGTDVFPGVNVTKITTMDDRVRAEGSGQSFEASYLIAADGVNSRIAQVMGFNKNRYYYCNVYALSYYMSGLDFPESGQIARTSAFLEDKAVRCYVVPRPISGEYNLLIVTVDPRVDIKASADYFMEKAISAPWFKKAKVLRTFSAVCNCYSPITEPYQDRVLIVGDAGSTQELEITGAMVSGWKAGQAIATAVQEGKVGLEVNGISQYVDWWKKAYIDYYSYDDFMKGNAFPYILPTADDVNYVFGLINETLPACWNPYSGLTKQAMRNVMATMQQDRPEVYQKLIRRALPARELLTEITRISKPVLE